MSLSLVGCGGGDSSTPAASTPEEVDPITIKLAMTMEETNSQCVAVKNLCEKITEETNGAIEFEYFFNGLLGSQADVVEMVNQGAPIITVLSTGYYCDYNADFGIYSPALDGKGNSVAGLRILEALSKKLYLSIF